MCILANKKEQSLDWSYTVAINLSPLCYLLKKEGIFWQPKSEVYVYTREFSAVKKQATSSVFDKHLGLILYIFCFFGLSKSPNTTFLCSACARNDFFDKRKRAIVRLLLMYRRRPAFPGRCQPSILGAKELNFRVRNGNGWTLLAITTDLTI